MRYAMESEQESYSKTESQHVLRLEKLYFAGLLAFSLVLLPIFFAMPMLDLAASISVIAFAIAIPALAACIVARFDVDPRQPLRMRRATRIGFRFLVTVGLASDLVGITSAFWHLWSVAGIVFIVSAFIVYIISVISRLKVRNNS
jgi:cation transport ATPase